ncbi:Crp/Fnr family transcriptional regulator [Acinetobacter qingfengensis]|uniref:Transcriptional regulator n=2 Tax=Acinetobacter qingfengensis TaxID=1262585 RepID=A0A1E7R1V3_9GAMM|nr:Crp/Fnr family transcriptional regulator [Acinetobacter qingfengensis]OEY93292.1 transcriptional regulator [Acinetobacter qingfengensis]
MTMNSLLPQNPISKYKHELNQQSDYTSHSEHVKNAIKIMENYQFIQHLTDQEKNQLIQNIKVKKYYHNQLIYAQNSPTENVNIIVEGTLKLGWTTPSGKYHTSLFMPAGTLINIVPVIANQPLIYDHIAQGNTIIANISSEIFVNSIQNNAKALFMVLKLICNRTQMNREHIFYFSAEPLHIRLAKELLFLVEYHAYQQNNRFLLDFKLSQENIAELLHTTRQSINKELSSFAKAGILLIKYNQIHILDYKKLSEIANGDNLSTTTKFL